MDIIINDESVTNDRGWRLSNKGCDLTRYYANPIVLYQHDTERIIGKANNLRIEGSLLIASIEFDTEDPLGKEVQRKAEKGFLRGVSPGFYIDEMEWGDEFALVSSWELLEISLVSIPSNRGAVKLYSRDGVPLDAESEAQHIEQLKAKTDTMSKTNQPNPTPSDAVTLSAEALQALALSTTATSAELSSAIVALSAECTQLKQKLQAQEDAERDALITAAVQDGRIKEADRDTYKKLYASDKELCKSVLASMTPATSLSAQVHQSSKGSSHYETLSWDELDKRNMLASLKRDNPELFTKKYKERFGTSL